MPKLNIKAIITLPEEKLEENTTGFIESGIISYKENNNTYVYLDINRHELIRENDKLNMKYIFNEKEITKGNIFVKDLNQNIELDIKTNLIEKDIRKYKVEYMIEKETFTYEVMYSEV